MLQVRLDGFVLLVELCEVGDDVFYDVGVGQRVDFRFLLCVGGDAACGMDQLMSIIAFYRIIGRGFGEGRAYTSRPVYSLHRCSSRSCRKFPLCSFFGMSELGQPRS